MIAARSTTPRDVELVELDDPAPGDGEVVVRMLACGVCGSDVSEAWVARKVPVVLGHELVGEVEAVGAGVRHVAPGDRVVVHHHAPCGACERCRSGHETLCERFRSTALDPGGFAERVRVSRELAGELLPTTLDPERATFVEPLACVLRALDRARVTEDDRLLVVGCGTGGLLAIAAARARGVEDVLAAEPRPERLAHAQAMGARTTSPGQVVRADVALVCAPGSGAIDDAFAELAPGGRLLLYATPGTAPLQLDAASLYDREVEVLASYSAGPADMRAALTLLESGAVDPTPLVTHRVSLAETARALELARTGEALKALVVP